MTCAGSDFAKPSAYLDPKTTEVDSYDPENNPTGNRKETADERHNNVKRGDVHSYRVQVPPDSPLLMDDPVTMPKRKTAAQKARERGWSEVFFTSYGEVLNTLEVAMNAVFKQGRLNEPWKKVVDQDPAIWQSPHENKLLLAVVAPFFKCLRFFWQRL